MRAARVSPACACVLLCATAWFSACVPWVLGVESAFESVGAPHCGALSSPAVFTPTALCVDYRKRGRHFGTHELVALLSGTAERLSHAHPDAVLHVGDLSAPHGGWISEHASHRTGRDVDLAFFLTDMAGQPVAASAATRIDRFGLGLRGTRVVRFDTARNWAVVRSLLQGDEADIQWIFVSASVKARLLSFAVRKGESWELIDRAERVLHQPTGAAPHDDHFHVRIFCPRGVAGAFCQPLGPSRPWRVSIPEAVLTDDRRLDLALSACIEPD